MSDAYKEAYLAIRDYVEGLPEMSKFFPPPPELIEMLEKTSTPKLVEIINTGTYRQILGLMKEQEAMLGLEVVPGVRTTRLRNLEASGKIDEFLDLFNAAITPQDNVVPFPSAQADGNVRDIQGVEASEQALLAATKEAGILNYQHMLSMHSDRAMCVLPTKETGLPMLACLWVVGQDELDRLMDYAKEGTRISRDSREPYIPNDTVGEN